MRHLIFFAALMTGLAIVGTDGSSWAREDNDGTYIIYGDMSCGTYLDAYSKTNLIGKNKLTGPHEIFDATGWINGYVSAYNELLDNSDKDVFGAIEVNQRYRWIASWCRDNMSSSLKDGLVALIKKYHPFRITPDPCPKKKP